MIAAAIARVVKDLINGAIGGLSYGPFLASAASVIIIALGAIAALNQVGIAAAITQPILYTVLVTGGAVIAIGVGGGLIKPMQERWERMLSAAERETNAQVASYQQGRGDAMRAPQHARRPQSAAAHLHGRPAGYPPGSGPPRARPRLPRGPRTRAPATPRARTCITPRALVTPRDWVIRRAPTQATGATRAPIR